MKSLHIKLLFTNLPDDIIMEIRKRIGTMPWKQIVLHFPDGEQDDVVAYRTHKQVLTSPMISLQETNEQTERN